MREQADATNTLKAEMEAIQLLHTRYIAESDTISFRWNVGHARDSAALRTVHTRRTASDSWSIHVLNVEWIC